MMSRIQVQLPTAQLQALRQHAQVQSLSAAEVMRRALAAYLQRSPQVSRQAQWAELFRHCGTFHSGHDDTALQHDDALAEALYDWEPSSEQP
ncbi:MAG: hypothetical protein ACPGUV_08565 [Polyangiales bacterium]